MTTKWHNSRPQEGAKRVAPQQAGAARSALQRQQQQQQQQAALLANVPKPVVPAPRQFVFTADKNSLRRAERQRPTIVHAEAEDDEDDSKDDDKDDDKDEEDAPPPPPPLFQADALLRGNGMSLFRDRRLYRKSVAIKSAWWAEEADLESNPVVPLLPGNDSNDGDDDDDGPAPPFALGGGGIELDLTGVDVSAAAKPLI